MTDDLQARLRATFLEEADELLAALGTDLLALERAPADPGPRRAVFRIFHTLKGAARAAAFPDIERAVHGFEALIADVAPETALAADRIAALFAGADALAAALAGIRRGEGDRPSSPTPPSAAPSRPPPTSRPAPAPPPPPARSGGAREASSTVRVQAARLDELDGSTTEIIALAARAEHHGERLAAMADALAAEVAGPAAGGPGRTERRRSLAREARALARSAVLDSRTLGQRARELRAYVRSTRLRPFADAADSLPRMVRDLAAQLGKEADFHLEGGALQVDRGVVDGLRDPLVQLVRNALDHGLEAPEVRARAGKPRRGQVTVRAALVGDRLVVTVADDGAGVDAERLRRRLAQRGGSAPGDARTLARELLTAGVSTRDAASTVSGRGVGLELARRGVESLGGRIGVDWAEGHGTTFTIESPSSLTATRVVLASIGDRILAVPTSSVERMIRVRPERVRRAQGRSTLDLEAGVVPIASLAGVLGPPFAETVTTGVRPALVLREGDERLVVLVDALMAETEIVARPIQGAGADRLASVQAAALLPSGSVALVLSISEVLRRGLAMPTMEAPGEAAPARVLVADDSITTRTLERTLLEEAGFEVLLAVDGEEAWTLLGRERVDIVVADVEMPRADGLELCRRIRADPRLRALPVVLVTSLGSPDDRRRGVEAGADAYVVKADFDRELLLVTIRQLLDDGAPEPN